MSFKTNARDLRASRRGCCSRRRWSNYAALWSSAFRASFVNSLVVSARSTALALLLGVPAAYALSRWATPRRGRGQPVDPGHPHGAADRLHHPLLPRLPAPRAARYAHRPGDHLPDLQPLAGDLDDAALLRPAAARARGGGVDRRRRRWRRRSCASSCRSRGRAWPRPRSSASSSRGTISSSR